ncbi:MAG: HAMP domain-containing histidine kinase, partial [Gemmatimonadota bacterium]|nr:HAMP domain-containing histidine kinase [Gemmatimonadota bacterium]
MRAMFGRVRINWLVTGCVAVLLLTVIAGVLQYSWINFASDAHRRQGREAMEVALRNFSGDFRDTLLNLPPFFRPPPDERNDVAFEPYMIEITRRWHSTSDRPQLLASISIGTQSDKGVVFRRLQTGDNQFKTEDWPNEFVVYRRILEERLRLPGGQPPLFPNGFAFEFFQGRPVLIFPLVTGAPTPEWQRPGGPKIESPPSQQPLEPRDLLQSLKPAAPQGSVHVPELRGWCFLEVDNDYLRQYLIPELVARHYGSGARYQVAVVASYPLSMIYGSDPTLTIGSFSQVDAGIVLLDANMQQGRQGPPRPRLGPQPFVSGPQGVPLTEIRGKRGGADDPAWLLVVKNKAGSLEALVDNARLHILGFSLIMLVLLAGSSVMLMLATMRARRLAQQQMEFVAGVSHELRTPLTAIKGYAEALLDDPDDVDEREKFLDIIHRHATRMERLVKDLLRLARLDAGQESLEVVPTDIEGLLRGLANDFEPVAAQKQQTVHVVVAREAAKLMTDAAKLHDIARNLIENAVNYTPQG